METTYEPFYARVGDVLDISPLFFNAGVSAIVRELAQNARRAGATALKVEHLGCGSNTKGTGYIVVRDNGGGCEPQDLMGFADSGWGSQIKNVETPAGIGFWSLANRGAVVRCGRGWVMELERRHFTGELPIAPRPCPVEPGLGLEITAGIPAGTRLYSSELKYYPFETIDTDGSLVPSNQQFLDPALPIYCFEGYSVQLKITTQIQPQDVLNAPGDIPKSRGDVQIMCNYNGHVLTSFLPHQSFPAYGLTVENRYERPEIQWIKVLVNNERKLPPTLPQRDSVQQGEEFDELKEHLRVAYERELDTLVGADNVWRDENLKWAGCIVFCDRQSSAYMHGSFMRMRPVSVDIAESLLKTSDLPCLDFDESRWSSGHVLDAMLAVPSLRVLSLRCGAMEQDDALEGWKGMAQKLLVNSVQLESQDPSQTEASYHFVVNGRPMTGLSDLKVILCTGTADLEYLCNWFLPFNCWWQEFQFKQEVEDDKLISPAILLSSGIVGEKFDELIDLIARLEITFKHMEQKLACYWGSDRRPSAAIVDSFIRILENLRDPLHAFEIALKAAVELACRRVPNSIWDLVKSATIKVDSNFVEVEIAKIKGN